MKDIPMDFSANKANTINYESYDFMLAALKMCRSQDVSAVTAVDLVPQARVRVVL